MKALASSGRIVVATRNEGKLVEYRHLLQRLGVEVVSLDQTGVGPEVILPEEGDTFESNALCKTRALQRLIGGFALGDDSGLEVDALNGRPGIYSARFAGVPGPSRDHANLEMLLKLMVGVADDRRGARFVCVVALIGPGGQELIARGTCEGRIIRVPRGENGFGYDPVFEPAGYQVTMAELPLEEKNRISHRARAFATLVEQIRSVNG